MPRQPLPPNAIPQLRSGLVEWVEGISPPLAEEVPSSPEGIPLAEEVLDDPPWINVVGSSMVWAYRIVPPGDYMTLGNILSLQLHLWFYRSGEYQKSPKPSYPYHKHAYVVPPELIEDFLTHPSAGQFVRHSLLGPGWRNTDPFRTNKSNGVCMFDNHALSPDS